MHERWSEGEGQVDHDIDEQQRLGARQSVLYTVSRGERVPRTSLNVGIEAAGVSAMANEVEEDGRWKLVTCSEFGADKQVQIWRRGRWLIRLGVPG